MRTRVGPGITYTKTSLTRGRYTNKTVESQFLVFKDILLQRDKEYIQILCWINLLMSYCNIIKTNYYQLHVNRLANIILVDLKGNQRTKTNIGFK